MLWCAHGAAGQLPQIAQSQIACSISNLLLLLMPLESAPCGEGGGCLYCLAFWRAGTCCVYYWPKPENLTRAIMLVGWLVGQAIFWAVPVILTPEANMLLFLVTMSCEKKVI